jgi:hypothetical protein
VQPSTQLQVAVAVNRRVLERKVRAGAPTRRSTPTLFAEGRAGVFRNHLYVFNGVLRRCVHIINDVLLFEFCDIIPAEGWGVSSLTMSTGTILQSPWNNWPGLVAVPGASSSLQKQCHICPSMDEPEGRDAK